MAAFVDHSPSTSALTRAVDPDAWITPEVQMLREVHHTLDYLVWFKTEGATKKPPVGEPVRLPLTVAEVEAAKDANVQLDPLPLAEMRKWLGW